MATKLLSAASAKVNSTGYLTQVVDPLNYPFQGTQSPEGQSFIVMAYAAFNQWNASGRAGDTGSDDPLGKYNAADKFAIPWTLLAVTAGVLSWSVL